MIGANQSKVNCNLQNLKVEDIREKYIKALEGQFKSFNHHTNACNEATRRDADER